ncbi:unnamed protein product [Polarella glacialis]|uniref:Uncharacterized protein n=1 Tax=Polarella glacialis TaxID=89957 RepID=A0A813GGM2_POLGL|nr:unnamed protein product [Polarella glacialis]
MRSLEKAEVSVVASIHPWRRKPGDALQSVTETLKLPSMKAKEESPRRPEDAQLWAAVDAKLLQEAPEEALRIADTALIRAREAGDKRSQATALYLSIHVKAIQEDREVIDNLPSLLREVAALYREVGDLTEEESILKDIMGYQLGRGAKNEVSKMEAEIRDLFAAKKQEVPAALLRIAAVHYASGGAERARLLAEEAVEAAATLGDQATQGLALLACAAVHLSQQKLDDAVKAVERAVQLQDDKRQKASGYYAIAQISISMEKGLNIGKGKQVGWQASSQFVLQSRLGLSEALAALKTARALMQEAGDKASCSPSQQSWFDSQLPSGRLCFFALFVNLKAREIEILQIVTELHLGRQEASRIWCLSTGTVLDFCPTSCKCTS